MNCATHSGIMPQKAAKTSLGFDAGIVGLMMGVVDEPPPLPGLRMTGQFRALSTTRCEGRRVRLSVPRATMTSCCGSS
jgi:hypothetical protein